MTCDRIVETCLNIEKTTSVSKQGDYI